VQNRPTERAKINLVLRNLALEQVGVAGLDPV